MSRMHIVIAVAASALVALAGDAFAQSWQCRSTETQPECHKRLKCHDDEDLEDCQKRLQSERGKGGDSDRGDRDRGDRDRGDRDRGDRDRSDRSDGSRRGGRDDGGSRSHSRGRRGGRRGGRSGGGGGGGGDHSFVANKTFGIGLEVGEPTGLTGKYFFSDRAALDFGVGWIYRHYYYDDGAHLYADFLFHPISLVHADGFELPLYFGVGLRYWDFEYCYLNVCGYDGNVLGIRIPFGIAFDFNNAPIDIFLQFVPTIDFVNDEYYDRYGDHTHTGVDFSFGIRFWPT